MLHAGLLVAALAVSGCATLPSGGPLTKDVVAQSESDDFVLVTVDETVSRAMQGFAEPGFQTLSTPPSGTLARNAIGVGDVLAVRILEAGNDGLFSAKNSGGNADFPAILVDTDGTISLPYVGTITAAGRTPREVQEEIVTRLEGSAIEPQAVVGVAKSVTNTVTVGGDAARPGVFPLTLRGDRLTEVVSSAGGSRFPARETVVTVLRGGRKGSLNLKSVLENPAHNILVQRGDTIVLTHEPRKYTITGAVLRGGTFPFDATRVSAMDAIGRAGGMMDLRADPTGVFILRFESRARLGRLGVGNLNRFAADPRGVPTVYRINLQEIRSRFYAGAFNLQDADAIFVSNSDSVQLSKLLRLIDLGLGTGQTAVEINAGL